MLFECFKRYTFCPGPQKCTRFPLLPAEQTIDPNVELQINIESMKNVRSSGLSDKTFPPVLEARARAKEAPRPKLIRVEGLMGTS